MGTGGTYVLNVVPPTRRRREPRNPGNLHHLVLDQKQHLENLKQKAVPPSHRNALLFDWPEMLRATVSIVTSPDQPLGQTTGLSDINMFDVLLFKAGPLELGVGPQLTVPSASKDVLGTDKWQAGAAAIAVAPQSWGLLGGLVTYQHSFAGDDDRLTQNGLQAQPFLI